MQATRAGVAHCANLGNRASLAVPNRLPLPSTNGRGARRASVMAAAAAKTLTADVQTFATALTELQKSPAPHYILFNADPDPHTGQPWCPDCVRAVPPIRAAAARSSGTLLEVTVGPRSAWKGNASHPFRVAPELKLTGIPTLLAWSPAGGATRRLGSELEACGSAAEVEQLLARSGFFSS
ncbi:hypothetical protein Agub_g8820 [Astrephomene gubernaculifera]|uniref:Thioredoxin domain-containing protein n=1 Tax=Astrephomene gubernaculifera TaxID=47775 RepID=A0AAD3DU64_9CHLO|nr:hypothetical protein Agub_g8820 [Astrephomene gubernaculifera]